MHDTLEVKDIEYYLCAYDKSQYKIGKIFEKKCAEYKQMEDEVENGEKVIHYAQEEEVIEPTTQYVVSEVTDAEVQEVSWYKRLWTFIT